MQNGTPVLPDGVVSEPQPSAVPEQGNKQATGSDWHELCTEAVRLVTIYCNAIIGEGRSWPWGRLPVRVEFVAKGPKLARFVLEHGEITDEGLSADVTLTFHVLYLAQDPVTFLENVLPECVCRMTEAVKRAITAGEVPAWPSLFRKVTGRDPLVTGAVERRFNRLAESVADGRTLGVCECEGRGRYRGLDEGETVRMGQQRMVCEACSKPFRLVISDRYPPWLADDLDFLRSARAALKSSARAEDAQRVGIVAP